MSGVLTPPRGKPSVLHRSQAVSVLSVRPQARNIAVCIEVKDSDEEDALPLKVNAKRQHIRCLWAALPGVLCFKTSLLLLLPPDC